MYNQSRYRQDNCCCGPLKACKSMNVNGKGNVKAKPDAAVINIGVITENKDLERARAENAIRMKGVVDGLKSMGVEEKDIQTLSYSIDTMYDYQEGKQIFRGYKVTNILKVIIRNIEDIGRIVDTATKNGANFIGNIDFTLSRPERYYRGALQMAIKDAFEKAQVIGRGIGVSVNPVPISVTEESYELSPIEPYPRFKAASTAPETPIQIGEIEVKAAVKMVFTY